MRKIFVLFMTAIVLVGCGSYRTATLNTNKNGVITHSGGYFGVFSSHDAGPSELADAKLTLAIANRIEKDQSGKAEERSASDQNGLTGVIYNQDLRRTYYFGHPEMSKVYAVLPGKFAIVVVSQIPKYVYGHFSGDDRDMQFRVFENRKQFNGIWTDWGARVQY